MARKPPPDVLESLKRLGLQLDDATLARLGQYLEHLLTVNERTNLTAVREPAEAWRRLVVDSLTLLPRIGADTKRLIDIGSGGGLPGIPVAIARPDLDVTLVEATGKKCAALRDFATSLSLDRVHVMNERAEVLGHDAAFRGRFDVATSRALAPLAIVLELSLPLLREGGLALAMKGPAVDEERAAAERAAVRLGGTNVVVRRSYPEDFENGLVIVSVDKTGATPRAYPRAPGQAKKHPL